MDRSSNEVSAVLRDHPARRVNRATVARSGRRDLGGSAGFPDLRGRRGRVAKVDRSDRPACRGVMLSASAVRWDPQDHEASRDQRVSGDRAVSVAQWARKDRKVYEVPKAQKAQKAHKVFVDHRAQEGHQVPVVRRAAMVRLGHEAPQDPRSTTTPSSTC